MEVLHLVFILANLVLGFRLYAQRYLVPVYERDHH